MPEIVAAVGIAMLQTKAQGVDRRHDKSQRTPASNTKRAQPVALRRNATLAYRIVSLVTISHKGAKHRTCAHYSFCSVLRHGRLHPVARRLLEAFALPYAAKRGDRGAAPPPSRPLQELGAERES